MKSSGIVLEGPGCGRRGRWALYAEPTVSFRLGRSRSPPEREFPGWGSGGRGCSELSMGAVSDRSDISDIGGRIGMVKK